MTIKKYGAGILVYRFKDGQAEIFLVHPGGPFWAKKDSWGIPKGEQKDGEDLLSVAKREFEEEVGSPAPEGEYVELSEVKRSDGRIVKVWAVEGNFDAKSLRSNLTSIEWPPHSGKQIQIPEVDKAEWMSLSKASQKIHGYQASLVEEVAKLLNVQIDPTAEAEQPSLF